LFDNICDVQILKVCIPQTIFYSRLPANHNRKNKEQLLRLQTNNAPEIVTLCPFFGGPIFLEWVINYFRLNMYAKCTYQNNF